MVFDWRETKQAWSAFPVKYICSRVLPGDSGGIEPICQFRTHRRLGIKVWSLGQEDRLEEGKTTHSSIVAWSIPWAENPGGLQSIGMHWVGHAWNDWAHMCICSWIMTADCDTWEEARWVWKGGDLGKGLVSGSCTVLSFFTPLFLPLVLWLHTGGGKTTLTAFARSRCPH